ncbi:hypothetical protein [Metamycoplasma salivarium]|uniref:Uncharacterized protein n=2 Tax=Metamycoplasma salivarium TaxID=2124 RepID=A0A448ZZG6_METSV|nr:hypothetical protein [Metamycoplasma salivarium]CAD7361426.1 Uncharacterised protein [Metamycoplasma salivarium]VEU56622.1 Uncharacterised protein [Metamycoplasma salivarium]
MTILKELLYTISSLPQIVNVSSTNTPNENIDTKNLEKLLSFINAQEGTINKIVNGKGLYQKRFETLTLEEKKNFFKEVMRNSATTKEQKNIIEEKLKDDKFVNEHLDSFFDSTIQNIIRAKSNENKSKKQLKNDLKEKKRLETDPEHYINDSSEVSSKKIYAELKQLEGILNEYEIILKPLLKKIEMIETIKYSLNLLQILLAASIVATTMVGIFFPPALTAIPHLSLASFAIGAIQIALEMYVTELKQLNNNNQNLLKALSVAFRGYGQLGVEKLLSKSYTRIDKIYGSNLTNKLNIILAIWSGIQNIRSAIASENEIRQIISLRDKMHTLSKGFISRWINFRERNIFVVIEETKQHGDYHEDGYGGQNILFKNLDENKIYTLEEMLAMPNQYLLMYKLIKVHDKNKGWYIRSLPNDIKEDNLG